MTRRDPGKMKMLGWIGQQHSTAGQRVCCMRVAPVRVILSLLFFNYFLFSLGSRASHGKFQIFCCLLQLLPGSLREFVSTPF